MPVPDGPAKAAIDTRVSEKQRLVASRDTATVPLAVGFVYQFARLMASGLLVALFLGGVLEAALRWSGEKPLRLEDRLSATIPDTWTGWRLRPDVRSGPDWVRTNSLSMHEDRDVTLAKPPKVFRAIIVGSSVVYGLGVYFKDTISAAAERSLVEREDKAQVLNFGVIGFALNNVAALVQEYAHQLQPDVIVLVFDLHMAEIPWPSAYVAGSESSPIKQLSWREGLLKRAAARSVVMTWFDDPDVFKRWYRRHLPFPLPALAEHPPVETPQPHSDDRESPPPPAPFALEEYQAKERQEIRAVLLATTAFCREMRIPIVFVTPYGPYFHYREEDAVKYGTLGMLDRWKKLYGSLQRALPDQAILITDVIRDVARESNENVVDLLPQSRDSTFANNPDFGDAVHFSAAGSKHVGEMIAETIHNLFFKKQNAKAARAGSS